MTIQKGKRWTFIGLIKQSKRQSRYFLKISVFYRPLPFFEIDPCQRHYYATHRNHTPAALAWSIKKTIGCTIREGRPRQLSAALKRFPSAAMQCSAHLWNTSYESFLKYYCLRIMNFWEDVSNDGDSEVVTVISVKSPILQR